VANERLIPIAKVPTELHGATGGGLSPSLETVRDWCKRDILESRKIAGRVYVVASSISNLLKGNES